jgi:Sec-independent protein secretion pathway component TatC
MRWQAARGPTFHLLDHTATRITSTQKPEYRADQLSSWLYLAFFNGLWVVFPLWILWEAYRALSSAMSQAEMVDLVNYLKKDD